jgi:hypothetical protein
MMCEDYPCCGHELNDCDGSSYSAENDPHLYCNHEALVCEAETQF